MQGVAVSAVPALGLELYFTALSKGLKEIKFRHNSLCFITHKIHEPIYSFNVQNICQSITSTVLVEEILSKWRWDFFKITLM